MYQDVPSRARFCSWVEQEEHTRVLYIHTISDASLREVGELHAKSVFVRKQVAPNSFPSKHLQVRIATFRKRSCT